MTKRSRRSIEGAARWPLLAAGLVALAVLIGPATSLAEEVTVSGCPEAGVEPGCIVLRADDGTVYELNGAEPTPELGVAGTVTGTVAKDMDSFCMQGIILSPATWQPKPGAACPAPKPQ